MSLRSATYSLLSGVTSKVYPVVAPQETTGSYAVYSLRITPVRCQDGISMYDVDVSLEVYAETWDACADLADSFQSAIEDASGTYDGDSLEVGLYNSETDDYISDIDKFNISQEYTLKFN